MPEKGIRFQRYVKYKAKCEANFGGGEKRIKFRGKVEGVKVGVLATKRRATPLMDARSPIGVGDRVRGQDPSAALRVNSGGGGVNAGSCHGERIARAGGYGEGGYGRGVGGIGHRDIRT